VPNAAACFAPSGACEAEERAAFEAQLMRAPESDAELLEKMFDMLDAPSGFPSLAAAHMLSSECLLPDSAPAAPKTRALLTASGLPPDAIDTCIDACFR
jgi:hypothetical protein